MLIEAINLRAHTSYKEYYLCDLSCKYTVNLSTSLEDLQFTENKYCQTLLDDAFGAEKMQ
jgi:hypothetical protein